MRELLLEIWNSVRRNKLRTFLTGFSVAWGIFMLVILLGSGNGLKNGVSANLGSYATNTIEVSGGWTSLPYGGYDKWRNIKLDNHDRQLLADNLPEVLEALCSSNFGSQTASCGNYYSDVYLVGCQPRQITIEQIEIVQGRFLNDLDLRDCRKVIVIDEALRRILFPDGEALGRELRIKEVSYRVVGIYEGDAQQRSSQGYIPLTTGQLVYKGNDPDVGDITLTVADTETEARMEELEQRIRSLLATKHKFAPTDQSAVWIWNHIEQVRNMSIVFGGINLFIWIIGLGTLLAGVVGVSNIMLVTVSERTAEFGIRKALGARPVSIIRLILTESVLITALFGYVGMVLGVAVMEGVNLLLTQHVASEGPTIFLNPTLDLSVAASATVVLVAAGLVAGYVPAYRAAQLKTIDALRYNK